MWSIDDRLAKQAPDAVAKNPVRPVMRAITAIEPSQRFECFRSKQPAEERGVAEFDQPVLYIEVQIEDVVVVRREIDVALKSA